jgi:glycine/D-amino acid oxidase-like deaminating enzyme
VLIIGSGISGAFAAHYLAAGEHGRDVNVVMVEAREACWGATGRVSYICSWAISICSACIFYCRIASMAPKVLSH